MGSGGSTLDERVKAIVDVFSPIDNRSEIVYCPDKRNSTQFVLDYSKTTRELGYTPHYSWHDYLLKFKEEMHSQPFAKLWGYESDYINMEQL